MTSTSELNTRGKEAILVLDFGSQYSQLIARRIREEGVLSILAAHDVDETVLQDADFKGVVLSGGPNSVYDEGAPQLPDWLMNSGLPVLGICYGMHLIGREVGCKVEPGHTQEYGYAELDHGDDSELFASVPQRSQVWMSHGDRLVNMPSGFSATASTDDLDIAAFESQEGRKIFGVQFHLEVSHTKHGSDMLKNFLFKACGCQASRKLGSLVPAMIEDIRQQVQDANVICALSGGVDSMVTAALIHRAIGSQLVCVFVDNGLLRQGELERVQDLVKLLNVKTLFVDARERFLKALEGVTDPEKKRKQIGKTFIDVFEEEANKLGDFKFLAQGTLYSDVVESKSATSKVGRTIKSHHNAGGLPEKMNFKLVEPLRMLFKDEVRRLGVELGLPEQSVYRHPFPGPGLAVRIIGEITEDKLEVVRKCDWVVIQEIKAAGLYGKLWQAFAVLSGVHTVGVMGDYRTYGHTIAIRAVESSDAMTANWAPLPYELLGNISRRIVNEVPQVNRVVYDITNKPPGTIEWE